VSAKRAFVLGLSPRLLKRFVEEGFLPNFKRLMEIGGFSKALPILPAQTPENWTSITTGAYPGTHGIAVWGRHDEGQPVTQHFPDEAILQAAHNDQGRRNRTDPKMLRETTHSNKPLYKLYKENFLCALEPKNKMGSLIDRAGSFPLLFSGS